MKLTGLGLVNFVVISFLLIGFVYGYEESSKLDSTQESNRVAVVVNDWLEPEIKKNLDIYLGDLKNEGYEPILKIWDLKNEPSPAALKVWLRKRYEDKERGSLQGAVFIGDLPIPYVKAHPVLKEKEDALYIDIADSYIAEMYYMDLVGERWNLTENYEFKDPYKSNWDTILEISQYWVSEGLMDWMKALLCVTPEIWTSRITTSTLTKLFQNSESDLVNAYLEKNHAYRTGKVVFPKQALVYALPEVMENDKAFNKDDFIYAQGILNEKYTAKEYKPSYIDDFFEPLENGAYQILFWGRHGMKTYIDLGSQDLKSALLSIMPVNVSTAFVFPQSCSIGHYVEPGYFGGAFTFNRSFFVLGMTTATLPTYGGSETEIMDKFIAGNNLGTAFRETVYSEFLLNRDFKYTESRIASRNSRYIIGDGTLKLQRDEFVANVDNSPRKYIEENYPYSVDQKSFQKYKEDYPGRRYLKKFDAIKMGYPDLVLLDAVKNGDKELVKRLLEKDVKLDAKDEYGDTAFVLAVLNDRIDIMELLLGKKHNVIEDLDRFDRTPLMMAVEGENTAIVELLLKYKANVEAKDYRGATALLKAKNIKIINLLLNAGAKVEVRDKYGNTVLHFAIGIPETSELMEIIKLLLNSGAKVEVKNVFNETAWDIAKKRGYSAEVLELLRVPEEKKEL